MLNEAVEAKAELRMRMRALRHELPAEAAASASRDAAERVLGVFAALGLAPREVALFLSLRGEIDTRPLALRLRSAGAVLSLPRMVGRDTALRFHRWSPGDPLRRGAMGVQEPLPEQPEIIPDVIVVPLLAFDRRGYRLGYGGGYYDRTLGDLRQQTTLLAIGFAFALQEVARVPTTERDQRLDWIVTETAALRMAGV